MQFIPNDLSDLSFFLCDYAIRVTVKVIQQYQRSRQIYSVKADKLFYPFLLHESFNTEATTLSGTHALCPCNGFEVQSDDQKHCWEVLPREASTWIDADDACQTVGGHIGYPNGDKNIIAYVQKNYTKPVLTNVIAASAQADLYAVLCPNNSFYGLLPNNTAFSQNATNTNTCAFVTKDSDQLSFGPCDTEANVLCDRPLEKQDYCKTAPKCPTTTPSSTATTTLHTTSTAPPAKSTSTIKSTTTSLTTAAVTNTTTPSTTPKTTSSSTVKTTTTTTTTIASSTTTKTTSAAKRKTTAAPAPIIVPEADPVRASTAKHKTTSVRTTTVQAPQQIGCGPDQWYIFGWCTAWPLLLILFFVLLALFLLCWILHCCCKLCVSPCQVKTEKEQEEKEEEKKKDPPIPVPIPLPARRIVVTPKPNPYVEEKPAAILPPPATISQPVFIPVPVKEPAKAVEPEIRYVFPPKPETADVGVNTDPISPVRKRKVKKIDTIQIVEMRRPRVVHSPLPEVDGDLGDDVSLHMERSHSADTVLPKGDKPDFVPIILEKNAKPRRPRSQSPPIIPRKRPISIDSRPAFNTRPISPVKVRSRAATRIPSPPLASHITNTPDKPKFLEPRRTPRRPRGETPPPSSPTLPRGAVSMRNPRGRMGGVVRAGGGGGPSPIGWKPWSSNSASSQKQQFLSDN